MSSGRGRASSRLLLVCVSLTTACQGGGQPSPTPDDPVLTAPLDRTVVALASDYQTGTWGVLGLDSGEDRSPLGLTHADAVGRARGDDVWVINRYLADNLQRISPAEGWTTQIQFSVGNGLDPHDVGFHGDDLIVSLFNAPSLGIFDPATGEARGSVDLSMFADADGLPEADSLWVDGDRAYVVIQRLDREAGFVPSDPAGQIAVVDLPSRTVVDVDGERPGVQGIPLGWANAIDRILPLPGGALAAMTMGNYRVVGDGGLEIVSTTPPYTREVVVEEAQLGGNVTAFATADGERFFLVVNLPRDSSGWDVDTALVAWDRGQDVGRELLRTVGFTLGDVTVTAAGEVLVCDRTATGPGIRIFDADTLAQRTTAPLDVGLPPFALVAWDAPTEVLP